MSREPRVVISGVGAVTPLAAGWKPTWEGLLAGKSGVKPIRRFDARGLATTIAGEVTWDQPQDGDPSEGDVSGRAIRFALYAAREALDSADLDPGLLASPRVGVYMGAGNGEHLVNQNLLVPLLAPALAEAAGKPLPEAVFLAAVRSGWDPRRSQWASPEAPAAALARLYRVEGPVRTHLTACAAGAQSVGEAFCAIRAGRLDRALVGGAHAMVHADGLVAFSKLGALSTRNDDPETASRPFDATRDGFILGEGSAVLVLETEEAARARGVDPVVEIAGYGVTADGYRATDPDPDAGRATRAILRALEVAGIGPGDLDYVNAHGTSTQANDRIETQALKAALGDAARRIPVSSVKSMLGHLVAAAGAVETAATYETLRTGWIPPTQNYRNPDPDCDLDYVPNQARQAQVRAALKNSSGFGGQNVSLVLRRIRS